ncbi:hypothetical protein KSS87_004012 [Heliosperma pusillum]|nr:hypothetical protein KSS87_004012 [Heliosperma pusillum]
MAHFNRIEKLPLDALREIMTRVGRQPGGAADIARTFTVSKTLRNFVDDGDVLRSISFKKSLPCFVVQYEQLSDIDGLVVRCARAGNSSAQFLLAKVVLANSSNLCSANIEASVSYPFPSRRYTFSTRNCNLADLHKAARLLNHFSVENTNPAEVVGIIRTFLSRGNFDDIVEMQRHLRNFVALFLVHGKKALLQQFLDSLDQLCEKSLIPFAASDQLTFLIDEFNWACTMGHNLMQDIIIDGVVPPPLLDYLFEMDGDVVYETLLQRVDTVEAMLKVVGQMLSSVNDNGALLMIKSSLCITGILREYLMLLIDREASVQSAQSLLLASYNAIFDV